VTHFNFTFNFTLSLKLTNSAMTQLWLYPLCTFAESAGCILTNAVGVILEQNSRYQWKYWKSTASRSQNAPAWARTYARTNGRTTRKHNASSPICRMGEGIKSRLARDIKLAFIALYCVMFPRAWFASSSYSRVYFIRASIRYSAAYATRRGPRPCLSRERWCPVAWLLPKSYVIYETVRPSFRRAPISFHVNVPPIWWIARRFCDSQ